MKKTFIILLIFIGFQSLQAQTCEQAVANLNHYYQKVVTKHQYYQELITNETTNKKVQQEKNIKAWYDKEIHFCLQKIKVLEKLCPSILELKTEDDFIPSEVDSSEANKIIQFEIPTTPMGFK